MLVIATVILVIQSTVGVRAARDSVAGLLASPVNVPPQACRTGSGAIPRRKALVLWDDTGPSAAYGAQSAALAANLISHFARPVRQPVAAYRRGEVARYDAVVYVGTNDSQPLPRAFLADVRASARPVLWLGENGWQLTDAAFARTRGWRAGQDRPGSFTTVLYRHARLATSSSDLPGIDVLRPARATVLATAAGADGARRPWAVRSGSLTYVSDVPLDDGNGNGLDRSYAIAGIMESMFGPARQRHRVLLRLEDIGPQADPAQLRQIADLLAADRIPFSVALYPLYLGPVSQHPRAQIWLRDRPKLVEALKYMLSKGGSLVLHGYTHQLGDSPNPDDGQSGEDYEFLRVHYDARRHLAFSPPADNEAAWVRNRMEMSLAAIRAAGLPAPEIWQFPEYAASPTGYRVAAAEFLARFERGNYAEGPPGREDLRTLVEQSPPYLVWDVYGGPVLPETLGYVVGPHVPASGPGSVQAILAAAAVQKTVVHDNVAGVYYHPFLGTGSLRRVVDGLRREGYQFVSNCSVLKGD